MLNLDAIMQTDEYKTFIDDWMEIGRAFLPEVPEEEMRKRVEAAAEKYFADSRKMPM